MIIRTTFYTLIAGLLMACIFVSWPLPASAAGKKGGGTSNVQNNSAKRGTANSLGSAGTAGAGQGAGGGAGQPPSMGNTTSKLLKKYNDTDSGINQNYK
jgi:hypothetical protein